MPPLVQIKVRMLNLFFFCWFVPFQEEDEVPDDETVNQMIARSEEEFDHFMVSTAVYYEYKLHP